VSNNTDPEPPVSVSGASGSAASLNSQLAHFAQQHVQQLPAQQLSSLQNLHSDLQLQGVRGLQSLFQAPSSSAQFFPCTSNNKAFKFNEVCVGGVGGWGCVAWYVVCVGAGVLFACVLHLCACGCT
jgi:hypothetical protein